MRLLGIDFGERRIGLAICDEQERLAVPLTTLVRKNDRGAARALARLVREHDAGGLVVGEPMGPGGKPGEAAARVRRFARRLAIETGLPVALIDETLTSVEAEHQLRAAGIDPRRHPERVDAMAAQILLQEALDRRRSSGGVSQPLHATFDMALDEAPHCLPEDVEEEPR